MTLIKGFAPAKVNLTLHVTGQRDDGYHTLDSLVVFADIGDRLQVAPSPELRLTVSGTFSDGVPQDSKNIVLKAADFLRQSYGISVAADITLEKFLPNAAGIGGGSSDAAMALSMLAQLWDIPELTAEAPGLITLGADVPACMCAPEPVRMSGIGEQLELLNPLPDFALVLVNPKVAVPTNQVFKRLPTKANPPLDPILPNLDFNEFARWVNSQRNDLLAPAIQTAPVIQNVLDALEAMPPVLAAGMSGSGATCFGLVPTMAEARKVARALQVAQMNWWVAPAQVLK